MNGSLDDNCIYYWDRARNSGDNNDSLYFTDQDRGTGGLSFALWKNDVCQFLINNALYHVGEFHVDGFRYDEISDLISMNCDSGWTFCRNLTGTLRYVKPRLLENAEFWPSEVGNYPKSWPSIVTPTSDGGAGFDVVQHDGLRGALRNAVQAAAYGQAAAIDFDAIAAHLYPQGFAHGWQAVPCVENHAVVKVGDSVLEMGEAHGKYEPMEAMFYLYVPDMEDLYRRALAAGATSFQEPTDQPYGDRNAGVKDAFGNKWYIATHIKDVSM